MALNDLGWGAMMSLGRRQSALLVVLCLALAACAGPIGTVRSDPKDVLRDLARSATTTGKPSLSTRNMLHVFGLFETYEERPEVGIEQLHRAMVAHQGHPALLFALAARRSAASSASMSA